jgi:hypothetical protein
LRQQEADWLKSALASRYYHSLMSLTIMFKKLAIVLPAVAFMVASAPHSANARTRDIVKYGAIGLGAAALYNMGQQSAYRQPYYGGGYYSGYSYPAYSYSYPSYSYGYSSYPAYGGYYGNSYYGGYYGGYGY